MLRLGGSSDCAWAGWQLRAVGLLVNGSGISGSSTWTSPLNITRLDRRPVVEVELSN